VAGGKVNSGRATLDVAHQMVSVTVPDDGRGSDLEISARQAVSSASR
jgi:chemotaxis protein histidine kinase CheA